MIVFDKKTQKITINSRTAKKEEKQQKIQEKEKTVKTNSSEVLNSYGRAFVNLNFKGNMKDSFDDAQELSPFQKMINRLKNGKIALIKKLLEDKFAGKEIKSVLSFTKSKDKEIHLKQVELALELAKSGNFNSEDINNILFSVKSDDKETNLRQIAFVKDSIKNKKFTIDNIKDILFSINSQNKNINLNRIDLVEKLAKNEKFTGSDIANILSGIENSDAQDDLNNDNRQKIKFINELVDSKKFRGSEIKNIFFSTNSKNNGINFRQIQFAKRLIFIENLDSTDTAEILRKTTSKDENINQNQIKLATKLIEDKKYDIKNIKRILSATDSKNKETNSSQIEFFDKISKNNRFDTQDVISILYGTKTDNTETNQRQIELFNRLLKNKKIENKDIENILSATNSDNTATNTNQINFLNELSNNKNLNCKDISDILHYTNNINEEVNIKQINFAKNLIQNNKYNTEDIKNILKIISYSNMSLFLSDGSTEAKDVSLAQIELANKLTKDGKFTTKEIENVFSSTISTDKDINLKQIDLAIEILNSKKFNSEEIKNILLSTGSNNKNINLNQIALATELVKIRKLNSEEITDLLYSTRSNDIDINNSKIFLVNNLIENEKFDCEDIKSILLSSNSENKKINSRQISLALQLGKNEKLNGEDITLIVHSTNSANEEINLHQIVFANELVKNEKFNGDNIWNILYYGSKTNDEKINLKQIEFARNFLVYNNGLNGKDVGLILAATNSENTKTNTRQLNLAKELILEEKIDNKDISFILYGTNSGNDEINSSQIELVNNLLKDHRFDSESIKNILLATKSNNAFVILNQIDFANELVKRKDFSAENILNILQGTNSSNEEINSAQIDFFDKLDQSGKSDKGFNCKFNGEDIGDILLGTNSNDIEDYKSKIRYATVFLREIDEENRRIAKVQAIGMIIGKDSITFPDIARLQYILGYDNVRTLKNKDIVTACKLIGLCKANDINQIPLEDKKNVIRGLVQCNKGCFKVSNNLKKFFPLIPSTQEEYCTLLPKLVKSLGIETKELNKEEINNFNLALFDLSNSISKISDEDFSKIKITQEYSGDDFIKDANNIVKYLSTEERQKVYDYFGFELNKIDKESRDNNNLQKFYTITGYPFNINNGKKLARINSKETKEAIERLRPFVIKYSEDSKISVSGIPADLNNELASALNTIVKYLPEFRTAINKIQHRTHKYDIALHSLKVMQKIVQNPEFNKLNDSDKKLMLLASLLHDISKSEAKTDPFHAENSSLDAYYITKKFNLEHDEELKLYSLIKNHEWLAFVNKYGISKEERLKNQQSVAFDLQYDNIFDMSKIFTIADLKAVKKDNEFYDRFKDVFISNSKKIEELITELKSTQPLFPVTKFPTADRIKEAVTTINPDGSTNLKGIYINKDGLVIIRYNEVENPTWEKIGFNKGTISRGITTTTSSKEKVNTGNIHFFVHGLVYENQLSKFDVFSLPDSDALLSVTYSERPESKVRFFRNQGVILDAETKYTYGGGESDSGSGCSKSIDEFKKNYIFDGKRKKDREYISCLIKKTLNLTDKEYLDFIQKNKNKSFDEIEPTETREALIKGFAEIDSNTRLGKREYNEMYISNPKVMGVFAYPKNLDNIIGDTMDFVNKQSNFLKDYAIKHNIPMVVFGD